MTFIINNRETAIDSYLTSLTNMYSHLKKHDTLPLIYNINHANHIVPILSGGGFGHEPAHAGYVGSGMLTGALCGTIFTPPTVEQILQAIQFLDSGLGVFVIIKNFNADIKNFNLAIQKARRLGHSVKYTISHDDISIKPHNFQVRSRGIAGTIFLHKIIGYAAKNGASLNELEALGLALSPHIATIGFATKSASLPNDELPLFDLEDGCISYGIGIHGEEGYKIVPFQSSELLANEIINKLKLHFHWQPNESYALLINNLGSITDFEMGIFSHDIIQLLSIEELHIPFIKCGKFMSSLNMSGISVTLCKLNQSNWITALNEHTNAFAW